MRPSSSNPSRAAGPTCRARLSKRGGTARHPGPYQDNIPVLVARDRKGATFHAGLLAGRHASIAAVLTGVVTLANHLVGHGGKPLAAFARRAGIPFHAAPSPGKPGPEVPHGHTASTPITDASSNGSHRFNGVATKNLPSYLGWRRALEGWGHALTRQPDRRRDRKWTIPTDNAIRALVSSRRRRQREPRVRCVFAWPAIQRRT